MKEKNNKNTVLLYIEELVCITYRWRSSCLLQLFGFTWKCWFKGKDVYALRKEIVFLFCSFFLRVFFLNLKLCQKITNIEIQRIKIKTQLERNIIRKDQSFSFFWSFLWKICAENNKFRKTQEIENKPEQSKQEKSSFFFSLVFS